MQRRVLLVICLLILTLSGCKTVAPRSREPLSTTIQEKKLAESLAHFSQALVFAGNDGEYSTKALLEYEKALTLAPDESADQIVPYLLSYSVSGQTNIVDMSRIDKYCTDYYNAKIDADETSPLPYITVARIHFRNRQDDKAISILKRGVANLPQEESIRLYCRLQGQEFFLKKEFLRAVACFELLSDKESDRYEQFHLILGELNSLLGQNDKAIYHYSIAAKGPNPIPEAYINLAEIYQVSKPRKAIQTMETACEQFPVNSKLLFFLGHFYSINDDYASALTTYKKIETIVGDQEETALTTDFYIAYGAAYEQSGDTEKAAEVFLTAIGRYPDNHQILNYLAYMWADKNENLDEAMKHIKHAVSIEKYNGAYIDTLGWVYFRQKKYEKAKKHLVEANRLMPNDPVIMEHIGDVYKAMDQAAEAVIWWKSSYFTDPDSSSVKSKLKAAGESLYRLRKESKRRKENSNETDKSPNTKEHDKQ